MQIAGAVAAIGTLLSPLFTHSMLREVAGGLGAAVMLWWTGFQLRERSQEMAELTRQKPTELPPPDK